MKTELEENTLVEDIRESLIEHEADEEGDAPLVSTRDEQGRFKPKEEPKEEPEEEAAPTPEAGDETPPEGTWTHTRPPSSWTPKAREDWGKIPEHLQKKSPAGKRRKLRERNSYRNSLGQLRPLWNGLKNR